MMQLRASEDGRMAALMEMQRIRSQLGYDQELHLDSKMEVEQMQDELTTARDGKRKSEMVVLELTEKLDLLNVELRTVKRTVTSFKRRIAQHNEDKKRNAQNMYAGMNMLTHDQQQQGGGGASGASGGGGGGGGGDGSGNPMMVQNMMHSPRSMVSMVGTMPQLPLGVLRVGNGPGFGGQQYSGMQNMPGPSLWQLQQQQQQQQQQQLTNMSGSPNHVPETEVEQSQGRRRRGNNNTTTGATGATGGGGYSNIHSREGGPSRPSPKNKNSPQQRVIRPRQKNQKGRGGGRGGRRGNNGGSGRGGMGYGRR